MLRHHIKNYTALSLYLLLASSSVTLHGMQVLIPIQKAATGLKKSYDSLKNQAISSHDAIWYNEDNQLTTAGYVFSSLVALSVPLHALYLPMHSIYTNPQPLANLLDINLDIIYKTVISVTPRMVKQTWNTLNITDKNYVVYILQKCLGKGLNYTFQRPLYESKGMASIEEVHGSKKKKLFFQQYGTIYQSFIDKTSNLITFASLVFLFYSAWDSNPATKWKAVATTAGLQLWIRYALHMAFLPKIATNDELIAKIKANHTINSIYP